MGNQMESSIFVLDPIKGVFWPFKVDRRIYLTDTVYWNKQVKLSQDVLQTVSC